MMGRLPKPSEHTYGPPQTIQEVIPRINGKVCTNQKSIHKHDLCGRYQCHASTESGGEYLELPSDGSLKLVFITISVTKLPASAYSSNILNLK
jgi:hypothetical protein